jgi:hypothetical protein
MQHHHMICKFLILLILFDTVLMFSHLQAKQFECVDILPQEEHQQRLCVDNIDNDDPTKDMKWHLPSSPQPDSKLKPSLASAASTPSHMQDDSSSIASTTTLTKATPTLLITCTVK